MRVLSVAAAVLALSACAAVEPPVSDLRGGRQQFRVELPLGAPGHAHEHARRCFGQGTTPDAVRRGNLWAGATGPDASEEENRTLHRCLLVIRDAQIDVR